MKYILFSIFILRKKKEGKHVSSAEKSV